MCGIAGIHGLGVPHGEARAHVQIMLDALRHRGPDESGVAEIAGAVLGHRRLSILDIEGGKQPFGSSDGTSTITYNGELYGFSGVRAELGQVRLLRSRSDTEVLLGVLDHWGPSALSKVNGMYAFGHYRHTESQLTLAVDPFGIKPLYYAEREGRVYFASELKPLCRALRSAGEVLHIDRGGVALLLAHGWCDAPGTLVDGICKMRPGEVRTYRNGKLVSTSRTAVPEYSRGTCERLVDQAGTLRKILGDAVDDQLVADVPVGLFLSGGLDSTLLLALAASKHKGLKTFSIGFREIGDSASAYDETEFAASVAAHFGAHHSIRQLKVDDVVERWNEILGAVDEPIADPAVIPLFLLAEFAAKHVKVCLSGDGGDEVFGGYQYHRLRSIKGLLAHISPATRRAVATAMDRSIPRSNIRAVRRAASAIQLALEPNLFVGPFRATGSPRLERLPNVSDDDPSVWNDADSLFKADLGGALAGGMLPKTDRITMRHSLEVRVPFLDDRVVRYGRNVPWDVKVRYGETKWVVRRALEGLVPERIWRRPKRGFRVPLDELFRGALSSKLVFGPIVHGLIGEEPLAWMVDQHRSGHGNHGKRLWTLMVLEKFIGDVGIER